jgi:putative acetyltransferase
MAAVLRPYQAEDRSAMTLVYYRAIREGAAAFYSQAEREAWAPSPLPDLDTPDKLLAQTCLVEEQDGRMTGFMSMEPNGHLDMAFVLPEVMGKGTAAALYDALMDLARAQGLRRFTVHAAHQSKRFLEKRGWQVDRFERYPADGQVYDLFHMSLTE